VLRLLSPIPWFWFEQLFLCRRILLGFGLLVSGTDWLDDGAIELLLVRIIICFRAEGLSLFLGVVGCKLLSVLETRDVEMG
jgi:hypothetical protein